MLTYKVVGRCDKCKQVFIDEAEYVHDLPQASKVRTAYDGKHVCDPCFDAYTAYKDGLSKTYRESLEAWFDEMP